MNYSPNNRRILIFPIDKGLRFIEDDGSPFYIYDFFQKEYFTDKNSYILNFTKEISRRLDIVIDYYISTGNSLNSFLKMKTYFDRVEIVGKFNNMFYNPDSTNFHIGSTNLSSIDIAYIKYICNNPLDTLFIFGKKVLYGYDIFYIKRMVGGVYDSSGLETQILNGSYNKGLAFKLSLELRLLGFDVQVWGNYGKKIPDSLIIYHREDLSKLPKIYKMKNKFFERSIFFISLDRMDHIDLTLLLGE